MFLSNINDHHEIFLHFGFFIRDAEGQTPFMLAINCRAYQAALILFDTIKRIANRDCVNFSYQPSAPPAHTTVPFYDNIESNSSTSSATCAPDANVSNTEEKLTKVMNAWFSKDCPPTTTTSATTIQTQTTGTAPVITPLHSQTSTSFPKRSTDVDWLYSYSQQPASGFNPVSPQSFDSTKSNYRVAENAEINKLLSSEENVMKRHFYQVFLRYRLLLHHLFLTPRARFQPLLQDRRRKNATVLLNV
mgnify:CR=1 FL=1